MAEAIGALHAEVTGNSAPFREELDKGKRAAGKFAKDTKRTMGRAKGAIDKSTSATKGLNASITASAGLMRNFGASSLGPLGELANNFATLGSGAGTAGIALVALTTTFLSTKEALRQLREDSVKTITAMHALGKASSELLAIRKRHAAFDEEQLAKRRGITTEQLRIDGLIASTERKLESAIFQVERLKKKLADSSVSNEMKDALEAARALPGPLGAIASGLGAAVDVGGDLAQTTKALNSAEGAVANLNARLEDLRRARMKQLEIDEKVAKGAGKVPAPFSTSGPGAVAPGFFDGRGPGTGGGAGSPVTRQQMLDDPYVRVMNARTKAAEEAAEAWRSGLPTLGEAMGHHILQVDRGAEKMTEELTQVQETALEAGDAFAGSFADAFTSFASGATKAKSAFADFAQSFLSNIGQMIAQSFALNIATGFTSAIGLGATEAPAAAVGAAGPAKLAMVSAPGKMASAGSTVNVHNYAGADVKAATSMGPNGPQIDIMVQQVVSGDLERGGPISRTLDRTRGTKRRGRRG